MFVATYNVHTKYCEQEGVSQDTVERMEIKTAAVTK